MKKTSIVILFCMALVLTVSGCDRKWKLAPRMFRPPDSSPEEYKKGWDDGCESGLSAYGNELYKSFYSFKQDVTMMTNVLYSKAWLDSFNYCRARVNGLLRSGTWEGQQSAGGSSPFFGGSQRLDEPVGGGGFMPPFMDGLNTPGWGDTGWGASVDGGSWLGGSSADKRDWLGRTPAYQ